VKRLPATTGWQLAEAGFDGVEVRSVAGDAFNSYFIATKRA